MNVIRIYGGLGNQFFQYALGKLQETYGFDVAYDLFSFFKGDIRPNETRREYTLDKFNVQVKRGRFLRQHTVREFKFKLESLKRRDYNFLGYWQYPEMYLPILPTLKKEFCVRTEFYTPEFIELKAKILSEESVSLHVRRGDYCTNDGFNVLPIKYYTDALKYVKGKVYVFSDDISWCKANFKDVEFVQMADYLEFELMKHCTHNIIANSTFSWWAAFLNDNPSKIVVAPQRWRTREEDQEHFMSTFKLPVNWIVL